MDSTRRSARRTVVFSPWPHQRGCHRSRFNKRKVSPAIDKNRLPASDLQNWLPESAVFLLLPLPKAQQASLVFALASPEVQSLGFAQAAPHVAQRAEAASQMGLAMVAAYEGQICKRRQEQNSFVRTALTTLALTNGALNTDGYRVVGNYASDHANIELPSCLQTDNLRNVVAVAES